MPNTTNLATDPAYQALGPNAARDEAGEASAASAVLEAAEGEGEESESEGEGDEEEEEEDDEDEDPHVQGQQLAKPAGAAAVLAKPAAAHEYLVGYTADQKVAWRCSAGGGELCQKQFTNIFLEPPGASEEDGMVAVWSDGYKHVVAALSVCQWRAMAATKNLHFTSEAGYSVREKKDRNPLIWISNDNVDKKKQICQLQPAGRNSMPMQEAVQLMIKVASALPAGGDAYELRNRLLTERREQNATPAQPKPTKADKAKRTLKRPACSQPAQPATVKRRTVTQLAPAPVKRRTVTQPAPAPALAPAPAAPALAPAPATPQKAPSDPLPGLVRAMMAGPPAE